MHSIMETILLLIGVCCIIMLLLKPQRPKNFPPGPEPLPVFGNVLQLSMKNPVRDLEEVRCVSLVWIYRQRVSVRCVCLRCASWCGLCVCNVSWFLVVWALWKSVQPVPGLEAGGGDPRPAGCQGGSGDSGCGLCRTTTRHDDQPCD